MDPAKVFLGAGARSACGVVGTFARMRISIVLAVALLPMLVQAQAKNTPKKEAKVRAWLAKGKAYKAIHQCDAMLGKDPVPLYYALRADGFNRIAEFNKAQQDAQAGLAALPGNTEALQQLAIAEQGLGLLDSAIVHFERVVRTAPSAEAHYRLAQAYQAKREQDLAISELAQAEKDAGDDTGLHARILRTRAECFALKGDTAASRTAFTQALQLAPADPVIYNSRGWYLYAANGDHARAIADYDKAIKLNPNYSYAFNNRGWSRYRMGDKDHAMNDLAKARRRKVFNPFVYRNLGIIALESGDTTLACTHFRRALDYNFTAMFGDEVQRLVEANCHADPTRARPVQAPNAPLDRPAEKAPPRSNAP